MITKTFKVFLAFVLAFTLCFPLSACQSNSTQTKTSQESYRWENFDDGSDVLSLDASYIPENVDDFSFNIILEQGTFKDGVSAEHISLLGAIQGWQVESAQKKDDVTASISIKKPNEWNRNGGSLAQIEVSSSAIDLPATEQDVESIKKAQEEAGNDLSDKTPEQINEELGLTTPTNNDSIDTTSEYIELSTEEISQLENETVESDTPTTYPVFAVFANPYLTLEQDSINLVNNKLTLKMKASDFKLDGRIDKSNLKVLDANDQESNITIDDAKLSSSSEIEVTLNLPNSDVNDIDDLTLVVNANANETQSDVKGPLKVQDPWLSVNMDNNDGTNSTFVANLNSTNDKISTDDVKVSVDGKQIEDATVKQNNDSSCEITIPSTTAKEDSIVQVSIDNIEDYAGQASLNVTGVSSIDASDQSRGFGTDLILDIGKSLLGEVAKYGFTELYNLIFGEEEVPGVSNSELLDKLNTIEENLNSTSRRVDALYDLVKAGQYGNVVNETRDLISRISGEEMILKGNLKEYNQAKTKTEKDAALKKFYADSSNKSLLNELAINLGVLYTKTMKADATSGKDLIQVYDDMCASSYNWASQAYKSRQSFRNEISAVWVVGISQLTLIYGGAADGAQDETLNVFSERTKNLNKIINETHVINESCCKKTSGSITAYYNYTNSKWYSFTLGSQTTCGWTYVTTPFSESAKANGWYGKFLIGFDSKYHMNKLKPTGKKYATTPEIKAMTERLHDKKTLEDELKELGATYAKYLVSSEKFDDSEYKKQSVRYHADWLMDTFEVAKADREGNGFTANMKHLEGLFVFYPKLKAWKNWATKPEEMFVLNYES